MEVQAKNPYYRHSGEEKDGWKGERASRPWFCQGPSPLEREALTQPATLRMGAGASTTVPKTVRCAQPWCIMY